MPLKCITIIMLLLPFWGCNGIFGGIYDDMDGLDPTETEYGFTKPCTASEPGIIFLDSRDFVHWIYIDFSEGTAETLSIDDPAPENWDIAIHHYDAKTNGGSAARTTATTFQPISDGGAYTVGEYESDVWTNDRIAIDLSDMFNGNIIYQESWCNMALSSWMSVDIKIMPPTYVHSGNVISVRNADGTEVLLRLANYVNAKGAKGYLTLEYIYPTDR